MLQLRKKRMMYSWLIRVLRGYNKNSRQDTGRKLDWKLLGAYSLF
jgi:hypothetical protein